LNSLSYGSDSDERMSRESTRRHFRLDFCCLRFGSCRWQPQNLLILSTKKLEGSHPDNKIQSPRSPRSAPIDEG
jgi:hypothetical protein